MYSFPCFRPTKRWSLAFLPKRGCVRRQELHSGRSQYQIDKRHPRRRLLRSLWGSCAARSMQGVASQPIAEPQSDAHHCSWPHCWSTRDLNRMTPSSGSLWREAYRSRIHLNKFAGSRILPHPVTLLKSRVIGKFPSRRGRREQLTGNPVSREEGLRGCCLRARMIEFADGDP
jgi:hypothetical protein